MYGLSKAAPSASFNQRDFIREQRRANRPAVRKVCLIGATILLGYLVTAPDFLAPTDFFALLYAVAVMLGVVLLFYFISISRLYLQSRWIEFPGFVALYLAQLNVNSTFFTVSTKIGSSPTMVVLYNTCILMLIPAVSNVGYFPSLVATIFSMALIGTGIVSTLGLPFDALAVQLAPLYTAAAFAIWANYEVYTGRRIAWLANLELNQQRVNTEALLYNVLPEAVANRLKEGDTVADSFSEVSVIFIDIVDFSEISRMISPRHLVDTLNRFFGIADKCAELHRVEKVKTIGDAYLAVTGATIWSDNCAVSAIEFARAVIEELAKDQGSDRIEIRVRVGIHTGAVIGGVIGTTRKAYDYWGDTVNLASRIQSAGAVDTVLVSESTYYRAKGIIEFDAPRVEILKGIGSTKIYPVAGADR